MNISPENLYSTSEAAGILRISEITAKRYVRDNVLPSFKVGGLRRIKGEDLLKTLNINSTQNSNPKGCELSYPSKLSESEVLSSTPIANLTLKKGSGESFLVSGDNLPVLKTLYLDKSLRGNVDLIYIDPPFGTGQEFVGYNEDHYYSDSLINTEFLEFLRRRLIFLRELLSERGSIYLHIDNKIGHYVKLILDEVFGEKCYRNDITRIKCNPKNFDRKAYGNVKDVIFFYSKSPVGSNDQMYWADFRLPLSEGNIEKQFPKVSNDGRRYATTPLHAKGETRNGPTGKEWKGLLPPKGRHWRYSPTELDRLDKLGLIEWSSTGNPRKIIFADENRGKKIQDIWDFKDPGYETSLYPTEKNADLLKQIILNSSPENGLVLDCFSGSGTTVLAANDLGRRWIGIDANEKAIKLTEKRLNQKSSLFGTNSFAIYKAKEI